MVSYVPTRYMSHGRRVFQTMSGGKPTGKYWTRTGGGGRTYTPKVSHITKGAQKFTIQHHNRVYHGGKPVAKYSKGRRISSSYSMLRRILSRRTMY